MSVFILAISCLTSNLPWFMNLSFQVPMQNCSLQHRILLWPPDTSTTERWFHTGPATSFFQELSVIALCSSPVAYWTPSDLGGCLFSSVISFCLFILFMGFSWQEYWSGLPFPPPVDHICQNSSLWPIRLGWPAGLGSQLHWVRQAPLLQQGCDPWRGSPHMLGYFYCMTNIYEKLFQT